MDFKNTYKYRIELHAHSNPASSCSEVGPEELIDRYKQKGYDAIVITNHFTHDMAYVEDQEACLSHYLADYDLACEIGKKQGMGIILGMELRVPETPNDYLIYGIDKEFVKAAYDARNLPIEAFYKKMKTDRNVILQAHPFRDRMVQIDPEFLDGIESLNLHPGHNSRVGVASHYAKEHNMIVTAGTDFHHRGHEGLVAMRTKELPKDSFELAAILKSRDYVFELGGAIVLPYAL